MKGNVQPLTLCAKGSQRACEINSIPVESSRRKRALLSLLAALARSLHPKMEIELGIIIIRESALMNNFSNYTSSLIRKDKMKLKVVQGDTFSSKG